MNERLLRAQGAKLNVNNNRAIYNKRNFRNNSPKDQIF